MDKFFEYIQKNAVAIILVGTLSILLGYSLRANIALKQRIEMISK